MAGALSTLLRGAVKARTSHLIGTREGEELARARALEDVKQEAEIKRRAMEEALLKMRLEEPANEERRRAEDRAYNERLGIRRHEQTMAEIQAREQSDTTRLRPARTPPTAAGAPVTAKPEKPLVVTEGERKAAGRLHRAQFATTKLGEFDNVSVLNAIKSRAGILGNFSKTPDYRRLEQAGRVWAQAVLRGDSGGAITPDEMREYFQTYLPYPGDDDATLEQKRQARQAVEQGMAIDAGRAAPQPSAATPDTSTAEGKAAEAVRRIRAGDGTLAQALASPSLSPAVKAIIRRTMGSTQ